MQKRLYKIEQGKKLCGVCGGFAEYFNLDPTLVRLIFCFICVCSLGAGILAYIIAAFVMPNKSDIIK